MLETGGWPSAAVAVAAPRRARDYRAKGPERALPRRTRSPARGPPSGPPRTRGRPTTWSPRLEGQLVQRRQPDAYSTSPGGHAAAFWRHLHPPARAKPLSSKGTKALLPWEPWADQEVEVGRGRCRGVLMFRSCRVPSARAFSELLALLPLPAAALSHPPDSITWPAIVPGGVLKSRVVLFIHGRSIDGGNFKNQNHRR